MDHGLAAEGMGQAVLAFMIVIGSLAVHVFAAALATIDFYFRRPGTRLLTIVALLIIAWNHAWTACIGLWPSLSLTHFSLWDTTIILVDLYIFFGWLLIPRKETGGPSAAPDRWVAPGNEEVERVLRGRRG